MGMLVSTLASPILRAALPSSFTPPLSVSKRWTSATTPFLIETKLKWEFSLSSTQSATHVGAMNTQSINHLFIGSVLNNFMVGLYRIFNDSVEVYLQRPTTDLSSIALVRLTMTGPSLRLRLEHQCFFEPFLRYLLKELVQAPYSAAQSADHPALFVLQRSIHRLRRIVATSLNLDRCRRLL